MSTNAGTPPTAAAATAAQSRTHTHPPAHLGLLPRSVPPTSLICLFLFGGWGRLLPRTQPELAERWRDEMRDALEVSRPTDGPPPASGPWLYTSNTNGTSAGGNAKTRGNFEIAARQQQVRACGSSKLIVLLTTPTAGCRS